MAAVRQPEPRPLDQPDHLGWWMDIRSKRIPSAAPAHVLEPLTEAHEPTVSRVRKRKRVLCEAKSLLDEWLVERVAAHDAVEYNSIRPNEVAGYSDEIAVNELHRIRSPALGGFLHGNGAIRGRGIHQNGSAESRVEQLETQAPEATTDIEHRSVMDVR